MNITYESSIELYIKFNVGRTHKRRYYGTNDHKTFDINIRLLELINLTF